MRKAIRRTLIAVLIVTSVALLLVAPLPPRRLAYEEGSPDGKYLAQFFWKPAGMMGLVTQDNPWVYLVVTERSTGRVVVKSSTWGDGPRDGIRLLGRDVPWRLQQER
jgi:hypothetical protein